MKRILTTVVAAWVVATLTISPLFGQNFTSRATLDQNFCGSSVLVIMERGVDGMVLFSTESAPTTAVATASAVSGIALQYVQDLTYMPRDAYGIRHIPNLLNVEKFQQIVLLRTEAYGKQHVLDLIEQLRFVNGVYYAEPNYFFETALRPNDPSFGQQWGMQSIQAEAAWAITTGSRDVRVGVIDIGFQGHTDLNANFDFTYAWCFNSNQALTPGNLGNTLPSPASQVGWHGNHVAGIIGAVGNNNIGVAGVAWHVSLVPFEVFSGFSGNSPVGRSDWQVAAVNRSIQNNIPIINMSMGGGDSESMRVAIQNYRGLFVWAAGNAASNLDVAVGPNIPNRLAVGAHNLNNQRTSFSCYGERAVEIWAPGIDIFSTTLNNSHQNAQGTSMAAPHVAGVAALMLSVNSSLTGAQLKSLMLEGSLPITIQQPATNPGQHQSRRLSAAGALAAVGAGIAFAPVFQGFEETINNDLPEYWQHSGASVVWQTACSFVDGATGTPNVVWDTEPHTGGRQMVRLGRNAGHFAWAFSEPMMLFAGTTYVVSFWYKAPGFSPIGAWDNFRVQIGRTRSLTGTGMDAQMQGATTVHLHNYQRVPHWTRVTMEFTPTVTGPHFVGFQCRTMAGTGWMIAIDDVWVAPSVNITLSEADIYEFPSAPIGYSPQTPRTITIQNTQNEPTGELSITLSGRDTSNFVLSTPTIPNIAGDGTAEFSVVPQDGLGVGVYIETITVIGDNNTSASFTVLFIVSDPTSIADAFVVETGHAPSLQVFPNPVTDQLHIVIPSETRGFVEIFDMNGQRVFTQHVETLHATSLHNDNTIVIDISHLPNGVYIVRIGNNAVRIIKQ